jgi:hypothetical protein
MRPHDIDELIYLPPRTLPDAHTDRTERCADVTLKEIVAVPMLAAANFVKHFHQDSCHPRRSLCFEPNTVAVKRSASQPSRSKPNRQTIGIVIFE